MISVAVATYNGEKYILKQLETIKNQTHPVDEVIICDDGSTDRTVQIIGDYIDKNHLENWHIHSQEVNLGFCLNFYDAIKRTNGDIIFLSDQDDVWYENKVEEMLRLYEDPEVMSVSCRYNLIDSEGKTIAENPGVIFVGEKNDGSTEPVTAESQVGCNYIRGCNMSFRKEVKDMVPMKKAETLLSHDWALSMAASLMGKNIYLNKYLAAYRFHDANASLSSVKSKGIASVKSKRVSGLEQSIESYWDILNQKTQFKNMTALLEKDIKGQIAFEEKRLSFVKSKNVFTWVGLLFHLKRYARYQASLSSGVRIWLGDLAYAFQG